MRRSLAAGVCVACVGLGGMVLAEDGPKGTRGHGAMLEKLLKEFDADGDGKLNEQERGAARQLLEQALGRLSRESGAGTKTEKGAAEDRPNLRAILSRFDKDGDGKLSDEEKAAALKGGGGDRPFPGFNPANPPEFVLKRFDKDGDGKLNDEEQAEMRRGAGAFLGGPGMPNFQEMAKRFDKDGDGKLSEEERAAVRAEMTKGGRPGGAPPSKEEIVKRFDKDGDGKLNSEEQAAARAAFEKRQNAIGGGLLPGQGEGNEAKVEQAELLKQFDKDGDGKLSEEEKAAARQAFQERAKASGEKK